MADELQDLSEDLETANAERDEAAKELESKEARAAVALGAHLESPSDATLRARKEAEAAVEDAKRNLEARDARVAKREAALNAATRDADRAELERLQVELRDRPVTYTDALARLAELDRTLEEIIKPLEALNEQHIETWRRAESIAHKLRDFAFAQRCPRPRNNEVLILARVVIGQIRQDEARRLSAHEYLEPFVKPRFNEDAAMQAYTHAAGMLRRAKERETTT